ncbi:MAG: hypothetical protein CW346_19560 [Bacillaceae bacterium]|uniref:DUF5808 domain-containing protein n=1 Tax=Symbiobacterium thermophilum (strain DSM 24528 / JCM 14929 / IAM 14863 / T) TaxID=292459 RepID=Q67SS8_SYMTH|nr:DUF5808 domain-containing protein [Symbiobacterium thermophilum]MBY6274337.1 hypothetical protein [Bacillaceae bacterium]BAD39265.1 conserved hypothetical protein [Symbiobacterium thermophilum IAM 14863]
MSGGSSGWSAPRHWKLGILYYHYPEDRRMVVPRRRGMGMTLNSAHKHTWFFVGALFLPLVTVLLLILVSTAAGEISVP